MTADAVATDFDWGRMMGYPSRETEMGLIMPDAFILSQWVVQPWEPSTSFDEPNNSDQWNLFVNGNLYGVLTYGSGGISYNASNGDVVDVNQTFLAGSLIEIRSHTTVSPNPSTNTYRMILTGTWLRN